jgi:hypothetical protein
MTKGGAIRMKKLGPRQYDKRLPDKFSALPGGVIPDRIEVCLDFARC